MKRGIIQSRGLGDIVIALPIAKYYADQGDEIVWPICVEFYESFKDSAPWVSWIPIETDAAGKFFLETPLQELMKAGCDPNENLYLYQYLNTRPDLTDPEFFSLLKFDQYKYAIAGVPFGRKWRLSECITRDPARESQLTESLGVKGEYVLVHLEGSTHRADIDLGWLSEQYPAAEIIEIRARTDNIWDWISAIEAAAAVVCVDSVYANIIDQMGIEGPDLYWIRRSGWDLTPVQHSQWTWVPADLPTTDPQRVNPAQQTLKMRGQSAGMSSHAPFQAGGQIPQNFMYAVKK